MSSTTRASLLLRMSPEQKDVLAAAATSHQMTMSDLLLRFVDWLDTLEPGTQFVTARTAVPPTEPPAPTGTSLTPAQLRAIEVRREKLRKAATGPLEGWECKGQTAITTEENPT